MEQPEYELRDDMPERKRLRLGYARLPKTRHGAELQQTHPEILQEWVMHTIERPYEQWQEYVEYRDEVRTILVGRVPEFHQWIKVGLVGRPDTGALHTAYPDK